MTIFEHLDKAENQLDRQRQIAAGWQFEDCSGMPQMIIVIIIAINGFSGRRRGFSAFRLCEKSWSVRTVWLFLYQWLFCLHEWPVLLRNAALLKRWA